jgi:hypothetical protein
MDTKKEAKKYLSKYFKAHYFTENDYEFKSLVRLLNKAVKNNTVLPHASINDKRWVCQDCGELVDGRNVTFEECHEGCGGRCV